MENLSLTAAQIVQGRLPVIFAISYLGGLLTAFTPCVYPLIPVTVGIMGARSGVSRSKGFLLAFCFVLGLASVYSVLGFLAASSGQLLGSLSQNPWLIGSVATVFFAMGLSLLGLFNVNLPSSWTTTLSKHGHGGFWGSFVLGGVSGLLAAPCSGPVVVGVLAYVAQKSNPLLGFSLLYVFSLGLGTPFLILGTFSQALTRLPKAGVWTEWVKGLCGLALIAASVVYAKTLLPLNLLLVLVATGFVLLAVFASRIFPIAGPWHPIHTSLRIVFATAAGMMIFKIADRIGSPPTSQSPKASVMWLTSFEAGLRSAEVSHKTILIDFWAEWCDACHELDAQTYANPAVQKRLISDFVTVKIDATDPSKPDVEKILKRYDVNGLPTVLFLEPTGNAYMDLTLTGFLDAADFLKLLDRVEAKAKS